MATVPNTDTFTLQDVEDVITTIGNSLVACFADADADKFDEKYEGSKDRLSNFRNYGHVGSTFTYLYYQDGPAVSLYGQAIHGEKGSSYFHVISNASGNHGIRTYYINSSGAMFLMDTYSGSASRGLWVKSDSEILYLQKNDLRVLKYDSGSLSLEDSISLPFGYDPADLTSAGGAIYVRGDWSAGETELLIYNIDLSSQLTKNVSSLDLGVSIYSIYTQGGYLFFSAFVSSQNRLYAYSIDPVTGDLSYASHIETDYLILRITGNKDGLLYCSINSTIIECYSVTSAGSISRRDQISTFSSSTGSLSYKEFSNFIFANKDGYIYAFRTDENDDFIQRALMYDSIFHNGDIYADFDNDIIVISDEDFNLRSYRLE